MQCAIFPISKTWISQEMNVGSHKSTKAIDFGILKPYYVTNLIAPFDGTIVHVDPQKYGGGIAFQSNEKVKYANGTIDYMTLWTGHDNNPPKVGSRFKQGETYSNMGTAGGVSKHCHLEVQRGKFVMPTEYIYINEKVGNVYKLKNTIEPFNALFINNETIIKYSKYLWKKVGNIMITQDVKRNENNDQLIVMVSNLRVRDNPNLQSTILGYVKENGIYNDLETNTDSNYTWHKIANGQWIADNGEWLKLLPSNNYELLYKKEHEKIISVSKYINEIIKIIE